MSKGYYLTQIDKLMEDSQYDARLTTYLLGGVRKMATEDGDLDFSDYIEVSDRITIESCNLVDQFYANQEVDA